MAYVFSMEIAFIDSPSFPPKSAQDVKHCLTAIEQRLSPYKNVDFHPIEHSFITAEGPYKGQVNVTPKNVGVGVSYDKGERHILTHDDMLSLSLHMYDAIKNEPDFDMALIGWELGFLSYYLDRNKSGEILDVDGVEGLVISNDIFTKVKEKKPWSPFGDHHHWIPCKSQYSWDFPIDDDEEDNEEDD